jgi:WD40 repeat protein
MQATAESQQAAKKALIVAVARYTDSKLGRLEAPGVDAVELAEVLGDPEIGEFDVETVLDEPEYLIRRRVSSFLRSARREDVLLMHFSGHGVKDADGHLYFAATDTEMENLDATAVASDWLEQQMTKSRSKRIVLMLDCCHSGAFSSGMRARAGDGIDLKERFEGTGRVVLSASDSLEYAYEGEELSGERRPSVFTSAVVEGLRTGAADRDRDAWVSIDELYDYVFESVRERTPNQTPSKFDFGIKGELFIARNPVPPDVEPADLPQEVEEALANTVPFIREGAVYELGRLLSCGPALAKAARLKLEALVDDDSRRISDTATKIMARIEEAEPPEPPAEPTPLLPPSPRLADARGVDWGQGATEVAELPHAESASDIEFSPDGRLLATAGSDGLLRVFDSETFELCSQMFHSSLVTRLAFGSDSTTVATASSDASARAWDVPSGRQLARVNHDSSVLAVAISRTGEYCASGGQDCTVRVWKTSDGTEAFRWRKVPHSGMNWVRDVTFSPHADLIAAVSDDRRLRMWKIESGDELLALALGGSVGSSPEVVAFSPDGRYVLGAGSDNAARVFDLETRNEVGPLTHEKPPTNARFDPTGKLIASGGRDGTARIWETSGWAEWRRFAHGDDVNAVAFSPDSAFLLTACQDKTARIWEVESGVEVTQLPHAHAVLRVAVNPDGTRIATCGPKAGVHLWAVN